MSNKTKIDELRTELRRLRAVDRCANNVRFVRRPGQLEVDERMKRALELLQSNAHTTATKYGVSHAAILKNFHLVMRDAYILEKVINPRGQTSFREKEHIKVYRENEARTIKLINKLWKHQKNIEVQNSYLYGTKK